MPCHKLPTYEKISLTERRPLLSGRRAKLGLADFLNLQEMERDGLALQGTRGWKNTYGVGVDKLSKRHLKIAEEKRRKLANLLF